MNAWTWGIVAVLIIVLVVGFMFWRSTPPVVAPTPTPTAALQDTSAQSPSLFLQAAPTTGPTGSISPAPSASGSLSASTSPVAPGVRISVTDTGFSPATVTVPVGATVTFVNNGQASHWPASDQHPTHTGLPGFDSKPGLATGEEYSFVFDKVGAWGFHDHLFPQFKGQVVSGTIE